MTRKVEALAGSLNNATSAAKTDSCVVGAGLLAGINYFGLRIDSVCESLVDTFSSAQQIVDIFQKDRCLSFITFFDGWTPPGTRHYTLINVRFTGAC